MRYSILSVGLAMILAGGVQTVSGRSGDPGSELKALVPSSYMGWTIEEDRSFDAETIFEYIDGAGEVYLSYNMRALFARRFKAEGKPALIADLFDMGTPDDAFGVFTHDLDGEDGATGQGSTYKGGLLSFWKGRYFVSVYTEDETPESRSAVFAVSAMIDRAIRETGEKPDLVRTLPPEGLAAASVCFFHNHSVLNYHFFVADENILGLGRDTAAVLAAYGDGPERTRLLVVRYPDAARASAGLAGFAKAYLPDADGSGLAKTEDGKWAGARKGGDRVIVVFGASSRARAEDLIRKGGLS
jgi:hypothetical protein